MRINPYLEYLTPIQANNRWALERESEAWGEWSYVIDFSFTRWTGMETGWKVLKKFIRKCAQYQKLHIEFLHYGDIQP